MNTCFAYKKGKGCMALKETKCKGCSFCKTMKEAEDGMIKAIERIRTLDKEKREHINETYYDGKLEV